jgi:hypothetical protein
LEQVSLRDVFNREVGPERAHVDLAGHGSFVGDGSSMEGESSAAFGGDQSRSGSASGSANGTSPAPANQATIQAMNETGTAAILPNPFLAGTRIVYRTPHATRLDAAIFDVSGQKIFGWPSLQLAAGSHELQWDGRSFSGSKVPAGVYLLRLESRDGAIVRKLFRVRS